MSLKLPVRESRKKNYKKEQQRDGMQKERGHH